MVRFIFFFCTLYGLSTICSDFLMHAAAKQHMVAPKTAPVALPHPLKKELTQQLKKRVKNRKKRTKILNAVVTNAKYYDINPRLVFAIIQTESAFNNRAVSKAGAVGLMQIMPFWKKVIGNPQDNLTDIVTNIRYGCQILSHYIKVEHGDLWRALARYNGSLGFHTYPERVYSNLETQWNI